jgi:hypothetical protein
VTGDDPFRRWRVSVFVVVTATALAGALAVACLLVVLVARLVVSVLPHVM